MKEKQVNVYDAYASDNDYGQSDIMKYHNQELNKDGSVLGLFTPNEGDIISKTKYELSWHEKFILGTLNFLIKVYARTLKNAKNLKEEYNATLLSKARPNTPLYDGDAWNCEFSPTNQCVYEQDECGEYICTFCGEPEERK